MFFRKIEDYNRGKYLSRAEWRPFANLIQSIDSTSSSSPSFRNSSSDDLALIDNIWSRKNTGTRPFTNISCSVYFTSSNIDTLQNQHKLIKEKDMMDDGPMQGVQKSGSCIEWKEELHGDHLRWQRGLQSLHQRVNAFARLGAQRHCLQALVGFELEEFLPLRNRIDLIPNCYHRLIRQALSHSNEVSVKTI